MFASLDSIATNIGGQANSGERSPRSPDPDFDTRTVDNNSRRSDRRRQRVDRHEHNFRRPVSRPVRRSQVPDFRRNPHRYTEYDLSTVPDHTDRNNTSAALSFLSELRDRRRSENAAPAQDYETDPEKGKVWQKSSDYVRRKHVFAKPEDQPSCPEPSTSQQAERTETESAETKEKPKFVEGKLTMPEYVVGESKMPRKEKKAEGLSCDALTLDHLDETDSSTDDKTTNAADSKDTPRDETSDVQVEKVSFKRVKRKGEVRKRREED